MLTVDSHNGREMKKDTRSFLQKLKAAVLSDV